MWWLFLFRVVSSSSPPKSEKFFFAVFEEMAMALDNDGNELSDDGDLIGTPMPFDKIKVHEADKHILVFSSKAQENFRAGESVEIYPPVQICRDKFSEVAVILKVDAHSVPQRVLLSLFMRFSDDMGILHEPPDYRNYIKYPGKHVAWTRYRGWFPVSRVRREAFVVAPWEVNTGLNDAELACGMSNAYCIVAKFNHDIETPAKAFELLGNEEGSSCMIPGCLYLALDLNGVTQPYWSFRRTVALKITDILSRSSLAASTTTSFCIDAITKTIWENFKRRTIPHETTERKSIHTKRTIRKNLAIEMLRGASVKHFARFDTSPCLELLKLFFGSGIAGAGRVCRFAGPKFSCRNGPGPTFYCHHIVNSDSVGGFTTLNDVPALKYYTKTPGIDTMHNKDKQQFTVRIRYSIGHLSDQVVRDQFVDPDPPPPPQPPTLPIGTEYEHDGTLFEVIEFTENGEVICEVIKTPANSALSKDDTINLTNAVVEQSVRQYNSRVDSDNDY
jgi:hypothetical protein